MDVLLEITNKIYLKPHSSRTVREGEHNFTRFVIKRPQALAGYLCRAEFTVSGTPSHIIVDSDDIFLLPKSLTKSPSLEIQLVFVKTDNATELAEEDIVQIWNDYDNGILIPDVVAKTNVVSITVGASINAVDEADTEFQDSIAQLAAENVTSGSYMDNTLSLYNRAGDLRFSAEIVGGTSGGLGIFAMSIDGNGDLIMLIGSESPPPISINDNGELVYTF